MEKIKKQISNKKSMVDIVTEFIRDSIIERKISFNEKVSMRKIAEEISISRTPIREAIRKLETEGLLELLPRRGFMVKAYRTKEIREIYEVREILEIKIIKTACEDVDNKMIKKLRMINKKLSKLFEEEKKDVLKIKKLNEDFHFLIYKASGNEIICEIVKNLWHKISGLFIQLFTTKEQGMNTYKEHEEIIDALEKKDKKKAEKCLRKHLKLNEDILLKYSKLKN